MSSYPTIQSLASEAVTRFGADPVRVQRAVEICAKGKWDILLARRNEQGQPVQQSRALVIVRGSTGGWYYVRNQDHTCTCPDSAHGHVCKHRLAAWLWYELIERTQAAVRRPAKSSTQLIAELGF